VIVLEQVSDPGGIRPQGSDTHSPIHCKIFVIGALNSYQYCENLSAQSKKKPIMSCLHFLDHKAKKEDARSLDLI
jgi:hypothetical protein